MPLNNSDHSQSFTPVVTSKDVCFLAVVRMDAGADARGLATAAGS